MFYDMGAWVLACVFHTCLLLTYANDSEEKVSVMVTTPFRPSRRSRDEPQASSSVHSALPVTNLGLSAYYNPYYVQLHQHGAKHAIKHYGKPLRLSRVQNDYGTASGIGKNEFTSLEVNIQPDINDDLDTSGFKHYKTATSINLEDPKQIETITTHSYHKKAEPYNTGEFHKDQFQKEESEDGAEIHYHQHKHLHKHRHKQDHLHEHKQDHKHDHSHGHGHRGYHQHNHSADHKHYHTAEEKHVHKNKHYHNHNEGHRHSHQTWSKREHNHDSHQHQDYDRHKHYRRNESNHDHYHKHKHDSDRKHNHDQRSGRHHHHGHKDNHKRSRKGNQYAHKH